MTPSSTTSRAGRCAHLLLQSAFVVWASHAMAQESLPAPQSHLTPEVCGRLTATAQDPTLELWQRDFMLELAQGGVARAAVEPSLALTGPESPSARSATEDSAGIAIVLPPGRYGHTATYDPVRDRMVVFGGADAGSLNNVWVLALSGRPTWSALAPSGSLPSARNGHTAVYDPVRDRIVVFGGWDGTSYSNDTWALSLSGSPAWSALAPAGMLPSARYGQTAIYDPVRDRMVVFGGRDEFGARKDVWALSLAVVPSWTALAPSGSPPSTRYGHAAIYDPVRDRMVVFGGYDPENGTRNDTWALSLSGSPAWSALAHSVHLPSARHGHTAIYDRPRDRMVVFGGFYADFSRNDAWALSLSGSPAWSALAPGASLPSTRYAHTAIYDSLRARMVVFGGHDVDKGARNDPWALSLSGSPKWSEVKPEVAHEVATSPPPGVTPPAKTTGAHPQTGRGIFVGLGLARGSADVNGPDVSGERSSGWGGSFRLGYVINPKLALGFESNSWVEMVDGAAATLGTFTGAVTVFPAKGLALRAGIGGGDWVGAGEGVSGEVGTGWTAGAAYEFPVGRTFAIGPQFDYSIVKLSDVDYNFYNIGLSMNWYFGGNRH